MYHCQPTTSHNVCSFLLSQNLSEKGVHEVSQRRFVLVSADHPSTFATLAQPSLHPANHALAHALTLIHFHCFHLVCSRLGHLGERGQTSNGRDQHDA